MLSRLLRQIRIMSRPQQLRFALMLLLGAAAAAAVLLIAGVSFYALRQTEKTDAPLLADQQESVEAYMTDDALDEWIAIYENIDNTIL